MTRSEDQRSIVEWFDATYSRRGARYLRPLRAYRIFPELLALSHGDALLDVACGPGMLFEAAAGRARRLHGCDISRVAASHARERMPGAHVVVANAEALPYGDHSFDVVTCLGSLERMLDRPRVLAEILRVGRDDARYCCMVRNSRTARWRYGSSLLARRPSRGHTDAGTLASWRRLFRSAGFRVKRVLPDQYPLMRRRVWRRIRSGDAHFRTEVVSRAPLERANEFIFILEKAR